MAEDLIRRLKHEPTIIKVQGIDEFLISKEDLAILLKARTDAANWIENEIEWDLDRNG